MENQTPLSIQRAIKDKCVCYCSHSVFLSVLCAPLGLLHSGYKSLTYGPFFIFLSFFFFNRKRSLLSGWRLTMAQGWIETYMTSPHWGLNGQRCLMNGLSPFLITKHSRQERHRQRRARWQRQGSPWFSVYWVSRSGFWWLVWWLASALSIRVGKL